MGSRQEIVESKTPMELGQINGLSDLPVPTRIQTLMRSKKRVLKSTEEKETSKKVSGSAQSLPAMSAMLTLPASLNSQLLVKSKIEDPEVVARNQEIIKTKSVSELSQIRDLSDFPIPAGIENFFKQNPVKNSGETNEKMSETASERPTSPQSFKEPIYETLPKSLREKQLVVKELVEDQDLVRERQELTRTKSPAELSQISSISEFPIPTNVENLLKKKSEAESGPEFPTPPPRKSRKEDIYGSIQSSSLNTKLMVRSREMEDPEELEQRKELIRTQTPAQLSEIHSLSEIPVPKFIGNLMSSEKKTDEPEVEKEPFSIEKIYEAFTPVSLTETKLLVKTETEDPEVQAARAEIVKSKSVNELSQITSLADIPIPDAIENFVKRGYAPVERKKNFKEKVKSQSTQSLSQTMYGTLPRSLKQDLLVKSVIEDPDVLAEHRAIVASKSVSELSQVTSFSDIPVPANLSRVFHKSMERLSGFMTPKATEADEIRPITPGGRSITENIYATLPKALKSELLVKSCVEEPEIRAERQALTQSKSVSELSQIKSLSDIPIPENIEKLISRTATNKTESPEEQRSVLIFRIRELEERVGDLETKLHRLEKGYVGRAVRFHEGD